MCSSVRTIYIVLSIMVHGVSKSVKIHMDSRCAEIFYLSTISKGCGTIFPNITLIEVEFLLILYQYALSTT